MAHVMRGESWRILYVLMAVPSFVYTMVVYFMIKESSRWLLLKGRRVEAIEAIKKMTRCGSDKMINSSYSNLAFVLSMMSQQATRPPTTSSPSSKSYGRTVGLSDD